MEIKNILLIYFLPFLQSVDKTKKEQLIHEKYKAWLYAPDKIITTSDDFIDLAREHNGEDGKAYLGKIILEMRKGLLGKKSKLGLDDIKFYHVT